MTEGHGHDAGHLKGEVSLAYSISRHEGLLLRLVEDTRLEGNLVGPDVTILSGHDDTVVVGDHTVDSFAKRRA